MEFFSSAVNVLKLAVIALGAGTILWGLINLFDGYSNDNPGSKSQGIRQTMAGAAIVVAGLTLVPMLTSLFTV